MYLGALTSRHFFAVVTVVDFFPPKTFFPKGKVILNMKENFLFQHYGVVDILQKLC